MNERSDSFILYVKASVLYIILCISMYMCIIANSTITVSIGFQTESAANFVISSSPPSRSVPAGW